MKTKRSKPNTTKTFRTLMILRMRKCFSGQEMFLNIGTICMIIKVTLLMERLSQKWLNQMSCKNSLRDNQTHSGGQKLQTILIISKLN